MNFRDIEQICSRAAFFTFSKTKLILTAVVLALCGLITIVCFGIAQVTHIWFSLSLTFLPLFISQGVLVGWGIILTRVYHDEIKNRGFSFRSIIKKSWETVLLATYVCIPIILCYLAQWLVLGIFLLLKEIPLFGMLFGVVFTFGPFLLNLLSLILVLISIVGVFLFTPIVALKSLPKQELIPYLVQEVRSHIFKKCSFFVMAVLPIAATAFLLWLAACLTTTNYVVSGNHMYMMFQWFFIMLPFAALLSPALIFFFNVAAEAQVFLNKR